MMRHEFDETRVNIKADYFNLDDSENDSTNKNKLEQIKEDIKRFNNLVKKTEVHPVITSRGQPHAMVLDEYVKTGECWTIKTPECPTGKIDKYHYKCKNTDERYNEKMRKPNIDWHFENIGPNEFQKPKEAVIITFQLNE